METTQKKGFFRGKLAKSFSRVITKPGSGSRKVVPCSAPTVSLSDTNRNMAKTNLSKIPMVSSKQPTGFQQHKAVSYFNSPSFYDHNNYANQTWGRGDENVDSMATAYISNIRQRFKLDEVNN